jgi:hypothetical protein
MLRILETMISSFIARVAMIEERAYLIVKEEKPGIRVVARMEHDLRRGRRHSDRRSLR